MERGNGITSFKDLQVYQRTYEAMLVIMKDILPKLPEQEKYDLRDQLSRACKAVPRLIAEGFAKKHQKSGFQKYLDDAMAECNEIIVSLQQCKDIYPNHIDKDICGKMLTEYDVAARQLYKLDMAWTTFKRRDSLPNNQ
jgi:four helix bundle protein